ncbi:[FeFe] hydrogenase H-cluster maturation GTPase HydF [Halodesulfovibrio marinisediminis]|uniref:Iron-only hydrogenase maturation protein HydF n=1 Tax=Halodesulfovibrio marinisediminis DSM 17456 TaxID=1121457 RepID=A0A1N6FSB7_9BACT|nr:[FeFe] hydrogenase H-cluster maturation GTPase HydF [Halodesulfovibrio marinisediminis]SIN98133.1 iron-only hydrogenase maturation protein HydF [Halodesulfovibrio marinisediminis DSM 17456]
MNTSTAPRGVRLIITLTGRCNAGKSALINALVDQEVAIVSGHPGTTTDPVGKHYELHPIGPVTFFDTAGMDDFGTVGLQRMSATRKVLRRTDVAILVATEQGMQQEEKQLLKELSDLNLPVIVVFNKSDLSTPSQADLEACSGHSIVTVSATTGENIDELKRFIIATAPKELIEDPLLVSDMVSPDQTVLLVAPIDGAAPKGRLILPQVQVLRDVLDSNAMALTVKETELSAALNTLKEPPALVVTDSQVIHQVAEIVPDSVPLTTFSTLFARYKGDLPKLVHGASSIDDLKDGDKVLMYESCSHHAVDDDIGRVKIPNWIKKYTGKELTFELFSGHDLPENLEDYSLAIMCGGCMSNRSEMMRRIRDLNAHNVPATNYGVAISKVQGVLERVIQPLGM